MTTIVNTEMAAAWDGPEGDDWTDNAERYASTDRYIWAHFRERGFVEEHDRVLDVGCGTGDPTRWAARTAAEGSVLGVDLSTRMLEYARKKTAEEGLTNVEYLRADAQVEPFEPGTFDVVMSVFGAMFFNDPAAAFSNIGRGMRPGATLALLAWQPFDRNEWLTAIRGAVAAGRTLPTPPAGQPGPFGLADRVAAEDLLAQSGFRDIAFTSITEPMVLGADADDAWTFVSELGIVKGLTEDLEPAVRDDAFRALRDLIEGHVTPGGVELGSAAWLISARLGW